VQLAERKRRSVQLAERNRRQGPGFPLYTPPAVHPVRLSREAAPTMSRRPPPGGEIVPEQRVRFQDADPEVIPLREPLPPRRSTITSNSTSSRSTSRRRCRRRAPRRKCIRSTCRREMQSRNPSPQIQAQQVSPQMQPRSNSPQSKPRSASPKSPQPTPLPTHHRRPSKEGQTTHQRPSRGDRVPAVHLSCRCLAPPARATPSGLCSV